MISGIILILNKAGSYFCDYAFTMFFQSCVLVVALWIIDLLIRKRVKAVFRYCMWMLIFVKLILPPTFCLPTGIGYWLGRYLPADSVIVEKVLVFPQGRLADTTTSEVLAPAHVPDAQASLQTIAGDLSSASGPGCVTWQGVVLLAWLGIVGVLSLLLIQRVWFVLGLIRQSEPAKGRLIDSLNESMSHVGIRGNVELRISHSAQSPAACGLLRPKILLPASLLAQLTRQKLRTVLIHELAHIKRGDLWVNLVQTVLQVIYFYNLLIWVANTIVRRLREQAVDEMSLVCLGKEAGNYSSTLIDIAEFAFARPLLGLRLIGVVESKKALALRIRHITERPFPQKAEPGIAGSLLVVAAAAFLLPMAKGELVNIQPGPSDKVGVRDITNSVGQPVSGALVGFVTGKSGRPCADAIITASLGQSDAAAKTDERGQFTLEGAGGQKIWIAHSAQSRTMGLLTVPENYTGGPIHVVLDLNEALIQGRIIKPNGKGFADRKVEFIISSDQGETHCLQSGSKTDRHGNYRAKIPCGLGLSVKVRLADGAESDRRFTTKAVGLSDNQTFIPMPILIVWPALRQ